MEKNIFELAAKYDFEAVKEWSENGNPINICDDGGNSLLTAFLDGYARFGDKVEDEEELLKVHDETDYEFWEGFLPGKNKTPLNERNGGTIVKQLEWFLSNGADLNLLDLSKDGSADTPLSITVSAEDYYLVEYLLEHGADPKVWLSVNERGDNEYEIFLIEDMDVHMMYSHGELFDNQLKIAALLARYGLVDFQGHCISIDKENRIITGHNIQPKF